MKKIITKQKPEVIMALEHFEVSTGETVLNLNSDDGALGLALASKYPDSRFLFFDFDIRSRALTERNIRANYSIRNADVVDNRGLGAISDIDVVVICPKRYDSQEQIVAQLALAKNKLKTGGKIFLISHKKTGAEALGEELADIFDGQAELIGRGKGGFRVFAAVKKSEGATETQLRRPISFKILGCSFDLHTEPSLFSKDDLDGGTRALLESVELSSFERLLDIGCGWGAIGLVAATVNRGGQVVMVDIDTRATKAAEDNARDLGLADRVKVVATDNIAGIDGEFDLVLSNPPFHAGTSELVEIFRATRRKMTRKGNFYLVVEESHLPKMQAALETVFEKVKIHPKIDGKNVFYILTSKK